MIPTGLVLKKVERVVDTTVQFCGFATKPEISRSPEIRQIRSSVAQAFVNQKWNLQVVVAL